MEDYISTYPAAAQNYARRIRQLVHVTAAEEGLGPVTEDLKWGEPNFSVPGGSPFRMDWKEETPQFFYLFFNCRTSLISTFREVYQGALQFEGSRAIVLDVNREMPEDILRHCFSLAMRYHQVKNLPLLGM
jgi:hypothetical protein